MNLVLVSARAPLRGRENAGAPHPSRQLVGRIAPEFAALGHDVRWLCLLDGPNDVAPSVERGNQLETYLPRSSHPSFRHVLAPLSDLGAEASLQSMLRKRPADVVHLFGFGTPAGTQLPWIAERMGARVVVSADTLPAICHRGTLIDETGAECERFDDAARCAECCLTADGRGDALGGVSAWLGRRAKFMGDASPWPDESSFLSRLDLVIGGAFIASKFLVEDEDAAERWRKLGLSKRSLEVLVPDSESSVDDLLECYGRGAVSSATSSR